MTDLQAWNDPIGGPILDRFLGDFCPLGELVGVKELRIEVLACDKNG